MSALFSSSRQFNPDRRLRLCRSSKDPRDYNRQAFRVTLPGMAAVLKVPDTLQGMASRWQTQAAGLVGTQPSGTGPSSQPSAASMSAVLAGTSAALAKLSARIDTSAAKVSRADVDFDDNEDTSAAELRALGGLVV
jgi:hypothetical protein